MHEKSQQAEIDPNLIFSLDPGPQKREGNLTAADVVVVVVVHTP